MWTRLASDPRFPGIQQSMVPTTTVYLPDKAPGEIQAMPPAGSSPGPSNSQATLLTAQLLSRAISCRCSPIRQQVCGPGPRVTRPHGGWGGVLPLTPASSWPVRQPSQAPPAPPPRLPGLCCRRQAGTVVAPSACPSHDLVLSPEFHAMGTRAVPSGAGLELTSGEICKDSCFLWPAPQSYPFPERTECRGPLAQDIPSLWSARAIAPKASPPPPGQRRAPPHTGQL